MPQIIMMNHAANVNYKRMKIRSEGTTQAEKEQDESDPVVWKGKRFSKLNSKEQNDYYSSLGKFLH